MQTITYPIAIKGLGTEFGEGSQPAEFASVLQNRFINIIGEAERRPGLSRLPSPVDNGFTGHFDSLAEHQNDDGSTILLASKVNTSADARLLFRYSTTVNQWVQVSGQMNPVLMIPVSAKAYNIQDTDKSVFVARDIEPSFYNSSNDKIQSLVPLIESGKVGSGSTKTRLTDAEITSWLDETLVNTNDLVYNATQNAFGIVTSVGAGNLDLTAITSAADGGTGIGLASGPMAPGDIYQIWDLVALNIIPLGAGIDNSINTAISTSGTNSTTIAISNIDFSATKARLRDYVYNTTRAAIAQVTGISGANLTVTSVSGQTSGDSMLFLKSAIPIASFAHVHYRRLYLVDAREPSKVRVSGPDDPQDFTTFNQDLDAITINYGAKQPQGEEILTLSTFHRYLIAGGRHNVYVDEGIDPIQDTTAATIDLQPAGLFSQGTVSPKSFANISNALLFASQDGMRQFNLSFSGLFAIDTQNIAEPIKSELRKAIADQAATPDNIQAIHYPRRNWVMLKVGNVIYNYNYTPIYSGGQLVPGGSWSKFTSGILPLCDEFLLKSDGSLVCSYYDSLADASYFYQFDQGAYDDDGTDIVADYKTAWLMPPFGSEDQSGAIVRDNRYIKPYFNNTSNTNYNITIASDLESQLLNDTVMVSARGGAAVGSATVGTSPVGGTQMTNTAKYPLRSRGEQFQIRIVSSASDGADVISKFVLYGTQYGRR